MSFVDDKYYLLIQKSQLGGLTDDLWPKRNLNVEFGVKPKQTNKETNKQTNKHKQTNKQTQTHKQTHKQTHTHKQTNNSISQLD